MFITVFNTVFGAVFQLVLLGAVGFVLVRFKVVSGQGLECLNKLIVGLFMPLFMFSEISARFSFALYPQWWHFPLYSLFITLAGYLLGAAAASWDKNSAKDKKTLASLVAFQNSGYLPLPLAATLFAPQQAQEMFIYIFLFLLGFNMTLFSLGVWWLTPPERAGSFCYRCLLNAPVAAILTALLCVFLKPYFNLPVFLLDPAQMLGRCAIPLSILAVGGNLAFMNARAIVSGRAVALSLLMKLIILPLIFLGLVLLFKPKPLIGLLLVLQAAMPPAALLSVIARNQNHSEELVNLAVFYGHLLSIVTIPVFLILYYLLRGPF